MRICFIDVQAGCSEINTNHHQICDITAASDVAYLIRDSVRPSSITDANDQEQLGELDVRGELIKHTWEHDQKNG